MMRSLIQILTSFERATHQSVALLLLSLTLAPPVAQAGCPALSDWLQAKAAIARAGRHPSLETLRRLDEAEWQARGRAATEIYAQYMSGSFDPDALQACLTAQDDRGNFLDLLQAVFYRESVARLRAARGPVIRRFVAMIDRRTAAGRTPLFRLTGSEFDQVDPGPWNAGFHRGLRSIYADFARIPHGQWLLIFVHEMLHGLDNELSRAIQAYGLPEQVARFASWAERSDRPETLAPADRAALDSWLEAGLGRGLWAEYRAWVPSFLIYEEGLREGLWPRIDWADAVLDGRPAGESLERYLYLYLDRRSPDPTEGIFERPLIRNALSALRARNRGRGPLPPLGNLGKLVAQ